MSGCDHLYGVRRTVALNSIPDWKEIEKRIQEVSRVKKVTHREIEPQTWYGNNGATRTFNFHQFCYADEEDGDRGGVGTLEFYETSKGEKRLNIYSYYMRRVPTRVMIDNNLKTMDEIYSHLFQKIPGLPEPQKLHEEWVGIKKEGWCRQYGIWGILGSCQDRQ
ncbi:MAG: hypothetical protein WCG27_05475 [Pseudomonadota bacterium]